MPEAVYLGLGSNAGDRHAHLARALRALPSLAPAHALSSVYETAPTGHRDQPDFWNLVARVSTGLDPAELLASLKRLEAEAGRKQSFRNAPRPLDIDILLYGDRQIDTPRLVVPHPRMLDRRFVLVPLVELDPELVHPRTGLPFAEHLAALGQEQRVRRLFDAATLMGRR